MQSLESSFARRTCCLFSGNLPGCINLIRLYSVSRCAGVPYFPLASAAGTARERDSVLHDTRWCWRSSRPVLRRSRPFFAAPSPFSQFLFAPTRPDRRLIYQRRNLYAITSLVSYFLHTFAGPEPAE